LYRLGSQNPQDNTIWGLGRVNLSGDSVSPGTTTAFSFVVTAPSSPGSYNFQWQMVQDAVEWFGAKTPDNIAVQVILRIDSAKCLPNMPLPLISSVSQAGGRENIASTAPSQAPKRCGHKNSD
jgi:hypothetical protein